MTLAGRHVVLGVSGGIASYKACVLARRLTESGASVDVVMTAAAAEFVGPTTFEALTGRPVLTSLWERGRALAHIGAARDPDLVIVAPATAHLLARAAQGLADDLLTALLLARDRPVLVAPAMNDRMFAHDATVRNLKLLEKRGWHVVGPERGPLAEGPSDRPGRMSEPETIFAEAERLLRAPGSALAGCRVIVTAGPTREALDPVRVITNRSSGRMGFALARAAYARGADVVLIAGPTALTPPPGPTLVHIETTEELRDQVAKHVAKADLLLMAAAPADYKPASPKKTKQPRHGGETSIALAPTPDILAATRAKRRKGMIAIGFAFEMRKGGVARARKKLTEKHLDLIALNFADDPESGTEVKTNRVTLVDARDATELPLLAKDEAAERILDAAERLL